ncbi:hypothetical protein AB0P19_03650 [Microbacterium oleivorans]|uniref:hypothetical protein n=1 Tax=Microbacterium oleivorans TaxID=273677 RepID=UPI003409FC71
MTRRPSGYGGTVNVRARAVNRPEPADDTQPEPDAPARPRWLVLPAKPSAPREDAASRAKAASGTTDTASPPSTPQRGAQPRVTIDRNLVTDPEAARRLARF